VKLIHKRKGVIPVVKTNIKKKQVKKYYDDVLKKFKKERSLKTITFSRVGLHGTYVSITVERSRTHDLDPD